MDQECHPVDESHPRKAKSDGGNSRNAIAVIWQERSRSVLIVMVAVGTPVTRRPPHRSVQADFLHTAPTSGA